MDNPEDDEDRAWAELTTAQFFKGYAESDAIYDDYFSQPHEETQEPNTEQLRSEDECH